MPNVDPIGLAELLIVHQPKIYYLATIGLLISVLTYFYTKGPLMDNSSAGVVENVLSSFDSKPINDIIIPGIDGNCPPNYEILEFGEWFGTDNGCSCTISVMSKGYCSSSAFNCISVSGFDPAPLYKWKNTNFCYSRVQNYINNYGPNCPNGYINCVFQTIHFAQSQM